jgi:hypothetical protein
LPRIDLPGGHWADLIDPHDLRAADMKAMRRNQALFLGQRTMGEWDAAQDVLLQRVITAWSLELPIPKELPGTEEEPGSLDRLPIPVYNKLHDELEPYLALINGEEPDPKPSSESDGTSADSLPSSATTSST